MKKLLSIALLALALNVPVFAQEATPEATQAPAPDVTVVVEAPATTQESNRFLMIVTVVSLLINALQAFLGHKSIPADIAKQIFVVARAATALTTNPKDEEVVDMLEKVYDGIAGTTTTTTTTTTDSPVVEAKG